VAIEPNNDAHNVALEWIKQIITLSTGVIALSATFMTHILKTPNWTVWLLILSWILLLLAIILGLETISVITNSRIHQNNDWTSESGRKKAKAGKYSFILGICFFALFALINFFFYTYSLE